MIILPPHTAPTSKSDKRLPVGPQRGRALHSALAQDKCISFWHRELTSRGIRAARRRPCFHGVLLSSGPFFGGEGHSRREATQLKHHEAARGSPASLLLPDYVRVHASFSKPLILGAKWTSSRASPGAFSLVMPSATPQSPRSAGHPAVKESQLTVSSGLQTHSCIMNKADSFNVTG